MSDRASISAVAGKASLQLPGGTRVEVDLGVVRALPVRLFGVTLLGGVGSSRFPTTSERFANISGAGTAPYLEATVPRDTRPAWRIVLKASNEGMQGYTFSPLKSRHIGRVDAGPRIPKYFAYHFDVWCRDPYLCCLSLASEAREVRVLAGAMPFRSHWRWCAG